MASAAIAPSSASTRTERYLKAEGSLWRHYGFEPHERFIDLDAPVARLRVLEVGSGEPVLFVHGTVGPGGWASLIRELPGFRFIVLERPGWGLSSAIEFSGRDYGELVAQVLRGALDTLELEWAHVVGGSIGNVWALSLAKRTLGNRDRSGGDDRRGDGGECKDLPHPGLLRRQFKVQPIMGPLRKSHLWLKPG